MANTRTWAEVIGLTQARAGAAFSSGTELTNIGFLLNSAARTIYDESRYWERYLVVEERQVVNGYISYEEDSYIVSNAGTSEGNGLYVRNGNSLDGNPAYTLYDSDGTTAKCNLWSAANTVWAITLNEINAVVADPIYSAVSTSTTPPTGGWSPAGSGKIPAPTVRATSIIGEFIGYWDGKLWSCEDPQRGQAYPDHNGIRIANCDHGDTVYVAYKKAWTDTYGNGESGTLATVPTEWAEFMAYDAARSYRASQSGEDGFNPIALRDVNNALERALMKVSRSGAIAALTNQLKTQYSVDNSI